MKKNLSILQEEDKEQKPDFTPTSSSLKQTVDLFGHIFKNMRLKKEFNQYHGVLLSGEPGTGKTQRIGLLSKLLGIELITIEAPHIIEEHIINIPFFSFNSVTEKTEHGSTSVKGDGYSIELADSNLYTQLNKAHTISDDELLKSIYSSTNALVIELFEHFGGNEKTIPNLFKTIRSNYNVILFLDEYFRQESKRIKNILRGILNNEIGNHEIPKTAFVVYATNLNDSGVSTDVPLNTQFAEHEMAAPTKDEWFSWLVFKFEKDKHIRLKKPIVNKFYHLLSDEDISYDDIESDVRVSPRRWEQVLLYINAALPCKNQQEAKNLLSNIKLSFKNYDTGEHAELAKDVLDAVAELIEETSDIKVDASDVNEGSDWRETLRHQIQIKEKLGKNRTYVPVIAGQPGVAKTAEAARIAKEENLLLVKIDVSRLNAEDVVGIPLPSEKTDGQGFETKFSKPSLYTYISNKIHSLEKAHFEDLKHDFPDDYKEKIKEFQDKKAKYLIFFDELNRNTPKVFNSIRKVLLEKNFGPDPESKNKLLKLPEESIMMAAMNPHDTATEQLSKHVRDVLDVIDAKASWKKTLAYMESQKIEGVDKKLHDFSLKLIKIFSDNFTSKDEEVPKDQRPFYLYGDQSDALWISPREYDMFYKSLTLELEDEINKLSKIDFGELDDNEIDKLDEELRNEIFKDFKHNLSFIFVKHGIGKSDEKLLRFFSELKDWIMHSDDIDIGDDIFYKKAIDTSTMNTDSLFDQFLQGGKDISELYNYLNNVGDSQFREDFTDFITEKLQTTNDIKKFMEEKTHKMKILEGDEIKDGPINTSLMNNFMLTIYYALEIHNQSYEKIQVFLKGISEGFNNAFKKKIKEVFAKEDEDKTDDDLFFEDAYYNKAELLSNFTHLIEGNVIKTLLHPGDVHSVEKHSKDYGDYLENVSESQFKNNFKKYVEDEITSRSGGAEACEKFFSDDQKKNHGVKHISIGTNSEGNVDISSAEHELHHVISYALARLLQVYYTMKIRKVDQSKIDAFADDMEKIVTDILHEKIKSDGDEIYTKSLVQAKKIFKQFEDIRNNKSLEFPPKDTN
jgi:MoxR-like ATPase